MKNTNKFLEAYAIEQEAIKIKEKAKTEEEVKKAKALFQETCDMLDEIGFIAPTIYNQYKEAIENGNKILDLYEYIKKEDVEEIVEILIEAGVKKFTFSGSYEGALYVANEFKKCGCELRGIVNINSRFIGEYGFNKIIPAYEFKTIK